MLPKSNRYRSRVEDQTSSFSCKNTTPEAFTAFTGSSSGRKGSRKKQVPQELRSTLVIQHTSSCMLSSTFIYKNKLAENIRLRKCFIKIKLRLQHRICNLKIEGFTPEKNSNDLKLMDFHITRLISNSWSPK